MNVMLPSLYVSEQVHVVAPRKWCARSRHHGHEFCFKAIRSFRAPRLAGVLAKKLLHSVTPTRVLRRVPDRSWLRCLSASRATCSQREHHRRHRRDLQGRRHEDIPVRVRRHRHGCERVQDCVHDNRKCKVGASKPNSCAAGRSRDVDSTTVVTVCLHVAAGWRRCARDGRHRRQAQRR